MPQDPADPRRDDETPDGAAPAQEGTPGTDRGRGFPEPPGYGRSSGFGAQSGYFGVGSHTAMTGGASGYGGSAGSSDHPGRRPKDAGDPGGAR